MRCTRKSNLEIHHKRRDGGNNFDNAEVLCKTCHVATTTYGSPGQTPPPFSESVKDRALRRAGNRCECTKVAGCH